MEPRAAVVYVIFFVAALIVSALVMRALIVWMG